MGCSGSAQKIKVGGPSCASGAAVAAEVAIARQHQVREEARWRDAQAAHVQKVLRFRNKCEEAKIGWVMFRYLLDTRGQAAPRRQDLPSDALVVGAPPARAMRWVISHPWLAKQHPDITGEQLAEVVDALQRLGAADGDVVFFDWLSMFQPFWGEDDRTPEEKRLFSLGLKSMNMLYSSDLCKVVIVSRIPESASQDRRVDLPAQAPRAQPGKLWPWAECCREGASGQPRELWLEPNPTPYVERGWCFFELFTTLLFGTAAEFSSDMLATLHEALNVMFSAAKFTVERDDWQIVTGVVADCIMDANDSEMWAKRTREMEECLRSGFVKLVKVGYLRRLCAGGGRLLRREDIPPEAFGSVDACMQQGMFRLSYCWQTSHHPDPQGFRLRDIVGKLDNLEAEDEDLAYIAYMSLFFSRDRGQNTYRSAAMHPSRTSPAPVQADERAKLPVATEGAELSLEDQQKFSSFANTLSMHPRSRTVVSWQMPPDLKTRVYEERGWCLADLVLSAFAGTLVYDDREVVDIVLEKSFMRALRSKTFTNGKTDLGIVSDLFKGLLYERAGLSQLKDQWHNAASGA